MKLIVYLIFILNISYTLAEAKPTICYMTLNSDNEKKVFQNNLKDNFNHVELTEFGQGLNQGKWFNNSCEQTDLRCDVLVISGHFAGYFFGDKGYQISLDEIEEKTCNNTCSNVFGSLKEVYLFGCNTLADKTKESSVRTPERYAQDLHGDDLSQWQIDEAVQSRYGILNDTYQSRMKKIFAGTSKIHGFYDKAPLGNSVEPILLKYLSEVGDYSKHLSQQELKNSVEEVNQTLTDIGELNAQDSFELILGEHWSAITCAGIKPGDPNYDHKKLLCDLYSESKVPMEKVDVLAQMLSDDNGEQFELFALPIMNFLLKNQEAYQDSYLINQKLKKEVGTPFVEQSLKGLAVKLKDSPTIVTRVLNTQRLLGFITEDEFQELAKDQLLKVVNSNLSNNFETFCKFKNEFKVFPKITMSDIGSKNDLTDPKNVYPLSCLNISDPQITMKAIKAIDKVSADLPIQHLLSTYSNLPGMNSELVAISNRYLNNTDPEISLMAHKIKMKKSDNLEDKRSAVKKYLSNPTYLDELYTYLKDHPFKDAALAKEVMETRTAWDPPFQFNDYDRIDLSFLLSDENDPAQMELFYNNYFLKGDSSNKVYESEIIEQYYIKNQKYPKTYTDYVIKSIMNRDHNIPIRTEHFYSLEKAELTLDQIKTLMDFTKKQNNIGLNALIKQVIYQQKHLILPDDIKDFANKGTRIKNYCFFYYDNDSNNQFGCYKPEKAN